MCLCKTNIVCKKGKWPQLWSPCLGCKGSTGYTTTGGLFPLVFLFPTSTASIMFYQSLLPWQHRAELREGKKEEEIEEESRVEWSPEGSSTLPSL